MPKKSVVPNVILYGLRDTDSKFLPFSHSLDGQTEQLGDLDAMPVNMSGEALYRS